MSKFKVGQKVVCIKQESLKDDVTGAIDNSCAPKKGEVCTIKSIHHYIGNCYFQLEEYPLINGRVNCINSINFRPLQYNKSSISELLSKEITIERSDAQPKEVETLK